MISRYTLTDAQGRIDATSDMAYPQEGWPAIEYPDDFDFDNQSDWKLIKGIPVYDPLPEEAPGLNPMEALREENLLLRAQVRALSDRGEFVEDCLAELAMKVYGGA